MDNHDIDTLVRSLQECTGCANRLANMRLDGAQMEAIRNELLLKGQQPLQEFMQAYHRIAQRFFQQ